MFVRTTLHYVNDLGPQYVYVFAYPLVSESIALCYHAQF